MSIVNSGTITDFRAHEATPGLSIIVLPDSPVFTTVSVSNDFVALTGISRKQIIGETHFKFFPGNPHDEDFTGENNLKASFDFVIRNKVAHRMPLQRYDFQKDGQFVTKYWSVTNAPIIDEQTGEVMYIVHSAVDITEKVLADKKIQSVKGLEKAYSFFLQAPVIIGYVRGEDYVIDFANEQLLRVWKASGDVIGKPLFKAFPELEKQGFRDLLDNVRKTGKPFFGYEHPIAFDHGHRPVTYYFDFIYQPFYDDDSGVAKGVISVGHDVTEKVKAQQKFKNVIEQSNLPILIFKGEEMILEAANQALFKFWKVDESALGKKFLDILPEMKGQGFLELLQDVFRTGNPVFKLGVPAVFDEKDGEKRTVYTNFSYQPYREANGAISGVIVMASDVTEQVKARKQIDEVQKKWKDLANSMPVMVWTADAEGNVDFFNERWYEFSGLSFEESVGSGWTSVLHPEDAEQCLAVWSAALAKQTAYEVEMRYRRKDGQYVWCIARALPVKEDGKLIGWYGTSTDINKHKELEHHLEELVQQRTREIEEKNNLLDSILKNSSNGISVSKLIFDDSGAVVDAQTIVANDAAVTYSGLPRELYLTKPASYFDPNLISSPYGQACIRTIQTGEPFIMQHFLEYSSRWLEITVSKMDEHHLIHNFTDVTPIKESQLKLEKLLEDLRFSNANLEEFAYAASHDLKEPIRKFQFYTNRLREELSDRLEPNHVSLFDRVENTASRMQKLVTDLLEYSQAAKGAAEKDDVDLNALLKSVLEDLELEVQKRMAKIRYDGLGTVKGNKRQLHQLFQNLVGNALKYSKPGVTPEIVISAKRVKGKEIELIAVDQKEDLFHLIEVKDNGVGFKQAYAEQIFKVFTRLHSNTEYRGSGVGLSIVKKVVEGHNGAVWAESEPEKGARFYVVLPEC